MPGAGDAVIDNLTLTQGTVLMLTDVGHCRNFTVIFEDGHSLAADDHYLGSLLRDIGDTASIHKAVCLKG